MLKCAFQTRLKDIALNNGLSNMAPDHHNGHERSAFVIEVKDGAFHLVKWAPTHPEERRLRRISKDGTYMRHPPFARTTPAQTRTRVQTASNMPARPRD
jgi:hypothetical protein